MKFKKDYINFLLHKTVHGPYGEFKDDPLIKSIADKIISVEDTGKVTFLVGKTEGLESLFKYLLYISDKIDKSQISIFNLKDNIEYDSGNLRKICEGIRDYKTGKEVEKFVEIPADKQDARHTIKIDISERESEIAKVDLQKKELAEQEEEVQDEQDTGMTLIENPDDKSGEVEVFELDSISKTVEESDLIREPETDVKQAEETGDEYEDTKEIEIEETAFSDKYIEEQESETAEPETTEEETITVQKEISDIEFSPVELESEKHEEAAEDEIEAESVKEIEAKDLSEPEIEIEVRKPVSYDLLQGEGEPAKEESVPNEAYYKFETKFFEEVKILEKLLATVDKEFKDNDLAQLSEKSLQSLTAIIEITSELSNLARQLMFDLIADVFLTMNIYFTKVISTPNIFESEKNKLFDSSLALVNSLIKGEDYLNYDVIIEKIEKLKKQLSGVEEEKFEEKHGAELPPEEVVEEKAAATETKIAEPEQPEPEIPKPSGPEFDSAQFKLKYLVKEFEKSFVSISSAKGEYSRFEALEKIGELNNALRLIAKISSSIEEHDVLKLAEVTYVFLKYLKDYRIDLLDAEIQQIVKYIIFTFKMLLTNRKPDDFNILVQHLNNPVKIFTDN